MLLDYSKNRTRRWYLNNEGSTVFNYNEFHMSHCNDWNRRFLSLGQVFIVKELDCKKILSINLRKYTNSWLNRHLLHSKICFKTHVPHNRDKRNYFSCAISCKLVQQQTFQRMDDAKIPNKLLQGTTQWVF